MNTSLIRSSALTMSARAQSAAPTGLQYMHLQRIKGLKSRVDDIVTRGK